MMGKYNVVRKEHAKCYNILELQTFYLWIVIITDVTYLAKQRFLFKKLMYNRIVQKFQLISRHSYRI